MNKVLKRILLGLVIWVIPFLASLLVWDMANNIPKISMAWFSGLMAFSWAVGFAIAACIYFRKISKSNGIREGWVTGITWYVVMLIMDLIVLVGGFKMALSDYYPMLLTYLNVVAISAAIGHVVAKK